MCCDTVGLAALWDVNIPYSSPATLLLTHLAANTPGKTMHDGLNMEFHLGHIPGLQDFSLAQSHSLWAFGIERTLLSHPLYLTH